MIKKSIFAYLRLQLVVYRNNIGHEQVGPPVAFVGDHVDGLLVREEHHRAAAGVRGARIDEREPEEKKKENKESSLWFDAAGEDVPFWGLNFD